VGLFLGLTYWIGLFAGMVAIRHRAGVGQGRIQILGREGFGLTWFCQTLVALLFWPVTLIIWLVRGRPEPRVVFNERAEERQRAAQAGRPV
jgi:hypothetical protein